MRKVIEKDGADEDGCVAMFILKTME